jgi:hypothetical protein
MLGRYAKTRDVAAAILKLVRQKPRKGKELARLLHKSVPAIDSVTRAMCKGGELVKIGVAKYGVPGSIGYASASRQIVAALVETGPMKGVALKSAIGRSETATAKAIYTLRSSGVLAPSDRGPVRLSAGTLAKVRSGGPVRNNRGGDYLAAAGAGAAAEEEGPLDGPAHCQRRKSLMEATKRATEALRKIGPTMDGPALQRFREEIAKIRITQRRIDEIRGEVR